MKKQLVLFIAITSLAWTACKKDNSNPTPENKQLLTKVTETVADDNTVTMLTYDNDKRISTVKTNDGEETKFTYNGDNLVTVENLADAENKTVLQITYAAGKPETGVYTIYADGVVDDKYKVTYTLTGDAVTQILMKDSTNTTEISKSVITYQTNNISKVENYFGGALVNTQEYTYGNKKSMFHNSKIKYVVDPFALQLFSANEVTKQKFTLGNNTTETAHVYTYDDNGFPLTAEVSEKELPNGETTISKLKFEY